RVQVVAGPGERGMVTDLDPHVQVTGGGPALAGASLTAGPDPGAVADARRYAHLDAPRPGRAGQLDGAGRPVVGLLEADHRLALDVLAAASRGTPGAAAAKRRGAAETASPGPEELGEEVAERLGVAEQVLELVGVDGAVLVAR